MDKTIYTNTVFLLNSYDRDVLITAVVDDDDDDDDDGDADDDVNKDNDDDAKISALMLLL